MSIWLGRGRRFLSDNFEYVLIVLAVVALVGGFLAYEPYADPGTDVERFERSNWSSSASFSHQATVDRQTEVFDEGTVLTNRPSYLRSIAPVLNGTFSYEYEASRGGDVAVTADLTLVLRSVEESDDGNALEYWREEVELGSASEDSVGPGQTVSVPFSMNVTEVSQRIERIESQLGGTPGTTQIIVESALELSGERNGIPVESASTHQMTIESGGSVYSVSGASADTDSGRQFGRERVEATYGPLRTAGGPLLLVVGLLGVGALSVGRWQEWFEVSEAEREWLDYRSTRSEFEEWITDGVVPGELDERTAIEVGTLEGLVDVAIDSDRRVIADESRGVAVVVLEDAVYRFEPPSEPTDGEPLEPGDSATASGVSNLEDGESADDAEERRAEGDPAQSSQ
jgi:hypothetical protein